MPSTAQNVAAVQANVRANAQDMASYLQDLAQWTQQMSQPAAGSVMLPTSTSSTTAASARGTAADHTYDRGYAKWDTWAAVRVACLLYQLTLARPAARALLCLPPQSQEQGGDEDTTSIGPAAAPTASTATSSQPSVPAPRAAAAVEVAIGTTADRTCCRL